MGKKYLVIPGNTDLNRGDQALIWESIRLFEEIEEKSTFYLLESGNTKDEIEQQSRQTVNKGYKMIAPILLHPGRITTKKEVNAVSYSKMEIFLWGYQALKDLCNTQMLLSKINLFNKFAENLLNSRQKETLKLFKECDGIIVKGGGFLHSYGRITDPYLMYYFLFHIILGHKFNKKVYVMPNSFGPFEGLFVKKLLKNSLGKCTLLTAREEVSQKNVEKELEIICDLYPDLGFFTRPSKDDFNEYLQEKGIPLGKKELVVFTLRPYRFPKSENPEQKYKEYIESVKKFIEYLIDLKYHVVLLAHTLGPSSHEDDRIALKEILEELSIDTKNSVTYLEDFDLTCEDLTKIYSYMNYMVGTRFHSVIFSINTLVPSLAIAYGGNKGIGIMKDIGLDNLAIPIEEISFEKLKIEFEYMKNNKEEIKEKLKKYHYKINNKREELKKIIKSIN